MTCVSASNFFQDFQYYFFHLLFGSFRTWGSNWKGLVKGGKSNNYRIHGGDNNAYVDVPNSNHRVKALRGGYIKDFVITHEDRNDVDDCLFEEIGQGKNDHYTSEKATEDFNGHEITYTFYACIYEGYRYEINAYANLDLLEFVQSLVTDVHPNGIDFKEIYSREKVQ